MFSVATRVSPPGKPSTQTVPGAEAGIISSPAACVQSAKVVTSVIPQDGKRHQQSQHPDVTPCTKQQAAALYAQEHSLEQHELC